MRKLADAWKFLQRGSHGLILLTRVHNWVLKASDNFGRDESSTRRKRGSHDFESEALNTLALIRLLHNRLIVRWSSNRFRSFTALQWRLETCTAVAEQSRAVVFGCMQIFRLEYALEKWAVCHSEQMSHFIIMPNDDDEWDEEMNKGLTRRWMNWMLTFEMLLFRFDGLLSVWMREICHNQ